MHQHILFFTLGGGGVGWIQASFTRPGQPPRRANPPTPIPGGGSNRKKKRGWIGGVSSGAPAMACAAEARGGHAIRSLTQTLHGKGEREVRREERVRIRPRRRAEGGSASDDDFHGAAFTLNSVPAFSIRFPATMPPMEKERKRRSGEN